MELAQWQQHTTRQMRATDQRISSMLAEVAEAERLLSGLLDRVADAESRLVVLAGRLSEVDAKTEAAKAELLRRLDETDVKLKEKVDKPKKPKLDPVGGAE